MLLRKLFKRVLGRLIGTVVLALVLWQTPGMALEVSQTHSTPLTVTQAQSTKPINNSTEVVRFERSQWGLTGTEWQRYLSLMQGIRGSVSPATLSPLEVLGLHAETVQERKKYARLWAKMLHEDVQRTLDFQRAYTQAHQELYGDQPLFDMNLLAGLTGNNSPGASDTNQQKLLKGDRLLVFLKAANCLPCVELVKKVLAGSANLSIQVDLYFTDTREPEDNPLIIAWAKQQQLDTQRLGLKTLTLNHDKGTFLQVSKVVLAEVPAVYRLRNNQVQQWAP
ncbi:MAG: TIGR03759 family integrating conjugative element protein [Methylococcales bacterium]